MKKIKKIIYTLGIGAAISIPTATIISCGGSKTPPSSNHDKEAVNDVVKELKKLDKTVKITSYALDFTVGDSDSNTIGITLPTGEALKGVILSKIHINSVNTNGSMEVSMSVTKGKETENTTWTISGFKQGMSPAKASSDIEQVVAKLKALNIATDKRLVQSSKIHGPKTADELGITLPSGNDLLGTNIAPLVATGGIDGTVSVSTTVSKNPGTAVSFTWIIKGFLSDAGVADKTLIDAAAINVKNLMTATTHHDVTAESVLTTLPIGERVVHWGSTLGITWPPQIAGDVTLDARIVSIKDGVLNMEGGLWQTGNSVYGGTNNAEKVVWSISGFKPQAKADADSNIQAIVEILYQSKAVSKTTKIDERSKNFNGQKTADELGITLPSGSDLLGTSIGPLMAVGDDNGNVIIHTTVSKAPGTIKNVSWTIDNFTSEAVFSANASIASVAAEWVKLTQTSFNQKTSREAIPNIGVTNATALGIIAPASLDTTTTLEVLQINDASIRVKATISKVPGITVNKEWNINGFMLNQDRIDIEQLNNFSTSIKKNASSLVTTKTSIVPSLIVKPAPPGELNAGIFGISLPTVPTGITIGNWSIVSKGDSTINVNLIISNNSGNLDVSWTISGYTSEQGNNRKIVHDAQQTALSGISEVSLITAMNLPPHSDLRASDVSIGDYNGLEISGAHSVNVHVESLAGNDVTGEITFQATLSKIADSEGPFTPLKIDVTVSGYKTNQTFDNAAFAQITKDDITKALNINPENDKLTTDVSKPANPTISFIVNGLEDVTIAYEAWDNTDVDGGIITYSVQISKSGMTNRTISDIKIYGYSKKSDYEFNKVNAISDNELSNALGFTDKNGNPIATDAGKRPGQILRKVLTGTVTINNVSGLTISYAANNAWIQDNEYGQIEYSVVITKPGITVHRTVLISGYVNSHTAEQTYIDSLTDTTIVNLLQPYVKSDLHPNDVVTKGISITIGLDGQLLLLTVDSESNDLTLGTKTLSVTISKNGYNSKVIHNVVLLGYLK